MSDCGEQMGGKNKTKKNGFTLHQDTKATHQLWEIKERDRKSYANCEMQQLYPTCNLESYILGFFCNCLHLKREDLQQEKMQLREWRRHSALSASKVIRAQMQQPIRVD